MFVNDQLKLKRQDDLENLDLEVIWLEVFPIKSKRSLFISGIYRPPWYSLADDIHLEKNIEQAYLLNKEPTYSNYSHRIQNIVYPVIGLADHLPLFALRKHSNQRERPNMKRINNNYTQYRNMKRFNAELFKQTLMQTPWDSVFIFDETDDVLDSWEKLSIDRLEQHCPWRTKHVAWVNQAPWITPAVIKQLQFRDAFLKKFRRHRNPSVWADYKKARNKVVGMLRNIKRKFYVSKLEQNENDTKGTWKIIKSISGMVKQSKRVNSL